MTSTCDDINSGVNMVPFGYYIKYSKNNEDFQSLSNNEKVDFSLYMLNYNVDAREELASRSNFNIKQCFNSDEKVFCIIRLFLPKPGNNRNFITGMYFTCILFLILLSLLTFILWILNLMKFDVPNWRVTGSYVVKFVLVYCSVLILDYFCNKAIEKIGDVQYTII